MKNQGIKQVEALKTLKSEKNKQVVKSIEWIFPKDMRTNEIKNEIDEIKNGKKELNKRI